MKLNRSQLRKMILNEIKMLNKNYLNEYTDDKNSAYDVKSSIKQSNIQRGDKSSSKSVDDTNVKKIGSRKETAMLNIEGDLESGLHYSYDNADHLADAESLAAVDMKTLLSDTTGFYDQDNHTEVMHLEKGNTRGTMIISSPYADMDKDTPSDKKARNTKFTYSVTIKNKMTKYKDMLAWYAALEKGGITKEEIVQANTEIQNKNVPHEEELDREIKKLNESYGLSRGSLYRQRYRRY